MSFYLAKVFSSKVFNELISTKLYMLHHCFSPQGFLYMMITSIFSFGDYVRLFSLSKRYCVLLIFFHRVFEEIRQLADDQTVLG
jgi:hypothetical protein